MEENFLKYVKKMNLKNKKEIAKKMKVKHSEMKAGNYKKHLDKVYKEEDNFSTRKGE